MLDDEGLLDSHGFPPRRDFLVVRLEGLDRHQVRDLVELSSHTGRVRQDDLPARFRQLQRL